MFLLLRTASEMEQVSRMKGALQKSWRGGERAVSWDGRVGRKAAWKTRRSKKQRAQVPATPDSLAGRCHQAQKTLRRARERRERRPHRKKCRRNALEANPEATPRLPRGYEKKLQLCKCDIFSPLSGNLPQKDFLRRAEAMHARWADIRARPRLVPDRKHPSAAAGPFSRTRMRRFYDATILGLRSPPRARRGGGGKNSLTTNMGVAGSVKYRSLHYFDSDILPGLVSSNEHFLPTGNI